MRLCAKSPRTAEDRRHARFHVCHRVRATSLSPPPAHRRGYGCESVALPWYHTQGAPFYFLLSAYFRDDKMPHPGMRTECCGAMNKRKFASSYVLVTLWR